MVEEIIIGDAADLASMIETGAGMDNVFFCMRLNKPQHGLTGEQVGHFGNKAVLDDALAHGVRKFFYISVFNSGKMMRSK
ncbi:MAG: hypothetical protein HGB06_07070 [Chlorobaculum sp.]|nr:hypothetical protein [Chlorobaculum sp.]